MGDLIQFQPRKPKAHAPDPKCTLCEGRGWIPREEGASKATASIFICDCMKGQAHEATD